MNTHWKDRIACIPEVLAGKPHIKGTRISVQLVLERLSNGWSFDDLMQSYPSLTPLSIQAALAFVNEIYNEESFVAQELALAA